jgi:hypothetical protein
MGFQPVYLNGTVNPAFCAGRRHQILFLLAINFWESLWITDYDRCDLKNTKTHCTIPYNKLSLKKGGLQTKEESRGENSCTDFNN